MRRQKIEGPGRKASGQLLRAATTRMGSTCSGSWTPEDGERTWSVTHRALNLGTLTRMLILTDQTKMGYKTQNFCSLILQGKKEHPGRPSCFCQLLEQQRESCLLQALWDGRCHQLGEGASA